MAITAPMDSLSDDVSRDFAWSPSAGLQRKLSCCEDESLLSLRTTGLSNKSDIPFSI